MLHKMILAVVAATPLLAGVSAQAATMSLGTDPGSWGSAGATADFQI